MVHPLSKSNTINSNLIFIATETGSGAFTARLLGDNRIDPARNTTFFDEFRQKLKAPRSINEDQQPPPLNLAFLPQQSSHPGNADGEIYNAHSPPIHASPEPEPGPLTEVENQLKELAQSLQAVGNYVQRFHHGIHPTQNQTPGQGQSQGGYNALGVGRGCGGVNGGINGIGLEDRPLSKRVQNLVGSLMAIDTTARQLHHWVPRAVLDDLDQSRNPGHITKENLEAVALENAFLHAKLDAIANYCDLLGDALADEWTELECLRPRPATGIMNGETAGRIVGPDARMEMEL